MRAVFASEAEIVRIGEGLFACNLPRTEWTHAAHFASALWLMRYRPELDAAATMPGLIRAYNESVGRVNDDSGGYHETITQASLRAARGALNAYPLDMPVYRIVNALMWSSLADPNWLLEYWSRDRLMSVEARRRWRVSVGAKQDRRTCKDCSFARYGSAVIGLIVQVPTITKWYSLPN